MLIKCAKMRQKEVNLSVKSDRKQIILPRTMSWDHVKMSRSHYCSKEPELRLKLHLHHRKSTGWCGNDNLLQCFHTCWKSTNKNSENYRSLTREWTHNEAGCSNWRNLNCMKEVGIITVQWSTDSTNTQHITQNGVWGQKFFKIYRRLMKNIWLTWVAVKIKKQTFSYPYFTCR